MQISIRLGTILTLNAFVVALALILGWVAQDVAGRLVEERYVNEMVAGASGFLKGRSYPRSDAMMANLRELFNAEWVAVDSRSRKITASSLSAELTEQFRGQMKGLDKSAVIRLGGELYRAGYADLDATDTPGERRMREALYALVPDARFQEARLRARERVWWAVLPAAAATTILAIGLSIFITRPIRKLAGQMDHLADVDHPHTDGSGRAVKHGPKEVLKLANSFYHLMDRLGEARRRMIQSEQLAAIGKISLSVAHELRNPLSGIRMNVRVLKDRQNLGSDEGIEAILREIDRMGLYLDELMSFSPGSDSANRPFQPEPVRLSELADSVLMILSGRSRHAKIEVHTDFPDDEPFVPADANQIRQAIMNFMVNAIEATPAGGTVSIASSRRGPNVRLSVTDTGRGVPDGDKDIFEAFTTRKPNGVGLGLYICRQIVMRHGGTIGYCNNDDCGATFWFELAAASLSPADIERGEL